MNPDHLLAPLLRELCPKRYPVGWPRKEAQPALDPVEIYVLACALGARGVEVERAMEMEFGTAWSGTLGITAQAEVERMPLALLGAFVVGVVVGWLAGVR